MAKENKSTGKVPNLRFPGFGDEWEEKILKEVLTIGSGRDYKHLSIGEVPVFGTGGLMTYVNEYIYEGESVCIGRKGTINKPYYHNGRLWTVDTLFYTHSFKKVLPKFVYYLFQTIDWLKYNEASGVPSLSKSTIEKIEIKIPAIYEQAKITNLLSALDERIHTQNKILQYYQSLIQNLREAIFKQKNRFKDSNGSQFPRWEICKLKDIAERVVRKNSDNNQNVLTISAQLGLISQLDFFNKSVSAKNVEGYYLLRKGDFAYNKSYSAGYPMGAIKRLSIYNQGIVSTLYICFRFNEKANPDFMEYYFESQIQNNELEKIAQEGARNHGLLNVGVLDFFNIEIQLPSFDEQVKIANLFSALNKRLKIEKDILDKLKRQKIYLLQNLFI